MIDHANLDLLTLDEAVAWRNQLHHEHKTLVVTNGCFDILHRGHASYLTQAAKLGDKLLVLLNSDAAVKQLKGEKRPVNHDIDRAYMLCALKSVAKAVIFDSIRCDQELKALAPDIYVKAGDYTFETLDDAEKKALLTSGSKIVFMPFVKGFSTTETIEKINRN